MKPIYEIDPKIEAKEDRYYDMFLDKAIDFVNGTTGPRSVDGIKFRQMIAAAGVVAKQRQTRSAMYALSYAMRRDEAMGRLTPIVERKRIGRSQKIGDDAKNRVT